MTVRAPVGCVGLAQENICIGRGVCAINPTKANLEYIFMFLIYFEPLWKNFEQGSTFTAVNSKDVKGLKLRIPKSIEEQTAIAAVLTTADDEITALQGKLALLKDQKKYLLNSLITGQILTPENV